MTDRQIDVALLREMVSYSPETGRLFWKARGPSLFAGVKRCAAHSCAIWNTKNAGNEAFTSVVGGRKVGGLNGVKQYAHRVAWALHYGAWPVGEIDHINGDAMDNRIENLRDVAHADNMRNVKRSKANTSGETGVTWDPQSGKWRARLNTNGRTHYFGLHGDFESAVIARKSAQEAFGFHANHGRS